jgi:hypothetical protein
MLDRSRELVVSPTESPIKPLGRPSDAESFIDSGAGCVDQPGPVCGVGEIVDEISSCSKATTRVASGTAGQFEIDWKQ